MSILASPDVQKLETEVEEATRANLQGAKRFVEPADGTLRRAVSKRHHIIFGRRGSGKSSLLRKAAADLSIDRRPIAYVDLETFKGHAYPDVLLSVLIESFTRFRDWLETTAITPATKRSWWQKAFGRLPSRRPLDAKAAYELTERLKDEIERLRSLLHSADNMDATAKTSSAASTARDSSEGVRLGVPSLVNIDMSGKDHVSSAHSTETVVTFQHRKTDFLHRHILEYRELFRALSALSDGDAYLFMDDLYYIRKADQASVIDYFHRIGKGNSLWLKVGTIRHRTRWYVHGDPSIGLKVGDDADEIDLDLTLEKFSITRSFLESVLQSFLDGRTLDVDALMTSGAFDRLVLASGGVARDFLNIFRRAIRVARERAGRGQQGERIGVEDINNAAGEYESVKREELHRDAVDDQEVLEREFRDIADFCKKTAKSNLFLIEQDSGSQYAARINELVDLRLLHKIRQRVTVGHRKRELFEAYMLDVSQYTASRKMKDFEILEFWKPENVDRLRREGLIYNPVEPATGGGERGEAGA